MHCGTRTPEFGGNYVELLFLPWKPKFCCMRGAPISRRFAPLLSRCRVDQLCDSDDVRAMPLTASVTVTRSGNELATAGNELATSPVAIVTVVSTLAIVSSARRRPAPPDRHCSQGEMARANLHRCRRVGAVDPTCGAPGNGMAVTPAPVSRCRLRRCWTSCPSGVLRPRARPWSGSRARVDQRRRRCVPPGTAMSGDAPGEYYPRVRRK